MDKWEYKIISVEIAGGKPRKEAREYERVEKILDKAGEEGWELVFINPRSGGTGWLEKGMISLFLKRKIE